MTKIMHVWSIIISVLLLSLSSCSKEDCEISVTGISLNKQSIEIKKGRTERLVATVYPQDATSGKVTWYSSDEDVATVDDNGVVSALNGGYTWIEARTENGYTAGCEVYVIVSVKSISLEYTSLTLTEGERHGIMETIYPEDATNKEVTWTSSNESVATVDNIGNVRAVKSGTATIRVKTEDGGKTASCVVTVKQKSNPGGGGGSSSEISSVVGYWTTTVHNSYSGKSDKGWIYFSSSNTVKSVTADSWTGKYEKESGSYYVSGNKMRINIGSSSYDYTITYGSNYFYLSGTKFSQSSQSDFNYYWNM